MVSDYFGRMQGRGHAVVCETFHPQFGWRTHTVRKRISGACVRRLRRDGVTVVALKSAGRVADFRIEELTARA